jgi:hypothetical protein
MPRAAGGIRRRLYLQKLEEPNGAITNQDYALVQLVMLGDEGAPIPVRHDLKKGEGLPLGYSTYAVTIPETKASFRIFKNSDGICTIRSVNGILLVETKGVAEMTTESP